MGRLLGLFDRQLRRGIGSETLVGDRKSADGGASECSTGDPLFGSLERVEAIAQAGYNCVVDLFVREGLGGVGHVTVVVGRRPVGLTGGNRRTQKLLYPPPCV